jgi:TM2 domain-containing membrane protein YozV
MKRDYYNSPKSSAIKRFFWNAAGADRYILERSTYADQTKYLCLGGIIIATGLMAAIAGGYAFYTIFEPRGSAINSFKTVQDIGGEYDSTDIPTAIKSAFFGIVWGLIIFNIDRFIVTSAEFIDILQEPTR